MPQSNMTESEFLRTVSGVLDEIQDALERAGIDADCSLAGQVLTIEFDDGARVVVNAQAPMRQLWLASRGGAMHFDLHDGGRWVDTRSGEDFHAALARVVTGHAGRPPAFGEA